MTIDEINRLIDNQQYERAVEALDEALAAVSDAREAEALYLLRGRTHWRLGRRGPATTDYEHALALNPDSPASVLLDNAREIEAFFNPDMLNP